MDQKKFTTKQRIFVTEYILLKNATKAAISAGYSAKTARAAGSRLLTNVDIRGAIESSLAAQLKKTDLSTEVVINSIKTIAFSDDANSKSNKLKALEILGKAYGLFRKKTSAKENFLDGSILLAKSYEK